MLALGMKDHPPDKATQNTNAIAQTAEHLKLAAELASKSIVLLKNKGSILPLRTTKRHAEDAADVGLGRHSRGSSDGTRAGTPATDNGLNVDEDAATAGTMPSVAVFGNPWFRAGIGSGGVQ